MDQHNRCRIIQQGILFLLSLLAAGCSHEPPRTFQGYAEGEYVYLSSPIGGKLERRLVQRGAEVRGGEELAVLEHGLETAAVAEAEQGLRQAENQLADLNKGERPSELSTIASQLRQARVALGQAEREFDRRQRLYREKTISLETFDQAKTQKESSAAQVTEIAARLDTARLGAREDQIKAKAAEVSAARERLAQARWRLDQKTFSAPAAGYVDDTFYEEGEFVPAAYPILSLLPPGNIKIRFFVPEAIVGTLAMGQPVAVSFDGGGKPARATISYLSSQAEFTPPVIYSRTTRTNLVYLVEARPLLAEATRFHPGQPVDVSLEPPRE